MPYRELAFTGTPGKSNVDIFPCRDCLVALSDWPPFVFSLKDIEMVYFERVSFGLRNFDMVFVHKDFSKPPMRVSAIPVQALEQIKAWLCELDLVYYEGPTNMNWTNIIKEVLKDKKGFAEAGGWDAWFGDSDGSGDDEDEDEDSEFDEDEGSDEEGSDDDEFDGDDDDSEATSLASEDSDDDSDMSLDSEESEGLDWDELEKKAAREDKERSRKRSKESDDESDRKKRRKK
jgi:nucleosome binding factor SPN SPT16 subunit